MGVTLERVQNKFACIIGELCSEPVILSQFAIWVDLRIAEYKAKGAISLDCSGARPDPTWLLGHASPLRQHRSRETTSTLPHSSQDGDEPDLSFTGSSHRDDSLLYSASDRLSPDVVVVKEEPIGIPAEHGDVFPVRLHRKRNFAASDESHVSFKQPRRDSQSAGIGSSLVLEPVNESLMSIIGANSPHDDDNNHQTSEAQQRNNFGGESHPLDTTFTSSSSGGLPATISLDTEDSFNNSRDKDELDSGIALIDVFSPESNILQAPGTVTSPGIAASRTKSIVPDVKDRIVNKDQKAVSTVRNIVAAVRSFERWLGQRHPQETRRVEQIPPSELNIYLADFFLAVKQPIGQDYTVQSFKSIKYNLEKFLKDYKYPCSLSSSSFRAAEIAFRKRLSQLGSAAIAKAFDNVDFPCSITSQSQWGAPAETEGATVPRGEMTFNPTSQ